LTVVSVLVALLAGTVFGLGLAISRMIDPAKVIAFLDVSRDWDPSLAFVMGSALLVTAPAFAWARRSARPLLGERFRLPTRADVDARLVLGAVLFGVGWGLAGFCPGPALASLTLLEPAAYGFVAALVAGVLAARLAAPAPGTPARAPEPTPARVDG
jgi:uncharacterized membrane protein YedE/YeeE